MQDRSVAKQHQYPTAVKNVPYTLAFGQIPRVGISNLLVDKKIMDKLHMEKELNQVTSIQYHGALDDNCRPLTQKITIINRKK